MPELPDITIYVESLSSRISGQELVRVRLKSPFLLRSVVPPIQEAAGRKVVDIGRIGKRLVLGLEGDLFILIHLMISGRLRWKPRDAAIPGKIGLAGFDFPTGTLLLTEASRKKRAALHLVHGAEQLRSFDRGGIEPLEADHAAFRAALVRENHTLKRALTDPRLLSGIGNAYSDEILHRARLSPLKLTSRLNEEESARLHEAARITLTEWIERLREKTGEAFPDRVTASRREMAVHGRFRKPCPVCATPVQRIVYAENECNYCPTCQTEGRVLADRALSRLLKRDWPRTVAELEEQQGDRTE
jgi:formamidopyrimidine-DNA glycosylase